MSFGIYVKNFVHVSNEGHELPALRKINYLKSEAYLFILIHGKYIALYIEIHLYALAILINTSRHAEWLNS